MADGAARAARRGPHRGFGKAEPREAGRGANDWRIDAGEKKKRLRVAYCGEEYGFGYLALENLRSARPDHVPDGGRSISGNKVGFSGSTELKPLRTKDQTLSAVVTGDADYAVMPLYSPGATYDLETLNLLANSVALAVDQIDARDRFCLAVYEPQVLDLVHASHPGSGLSYLMRGAGSWRQRTNWSPPPVDRGVDVRGLNDGGTNSSHANNRRDFVAGLSNIDLAAQAMLRDRVELIFAGPEAARRCKSKLNGLKAAGVAVQETAQWVEPHREMARRVREALDRGRQTSTSFDPATGEAKFTSIMSSEAQSRPLYGVVLPFEVAARSPEFTIVDDDLEDGDEPGTRFVVVQKQVDPTFIDDTYHLPERRAQYWLKRLCNVAGIPASLKVDAHGVARSLIPLGFILSLLFLAGSYIAAGGASFAGVDPALRAMVESVAALASSPAIGAVGALLIAIPWAALFVFDYVAGLGSDRNKGVRVLMKFSRQGAVASLADIEEYLRYHGVSYATTRLADDGGKDKPADIMIDAEFSRRHFDWHPINLQSPVRQFLHRAFNMTRHGKAKILAAMPYDGQQLPKTARRRWWLEGVMASLRGFRRESEASALLFFRRMWDFGMLLFAVALIAAVLLALTGDLSAALSSLAAR